MERVALAALFHLGARLSGAARIACAAALTTVAIARVSAWMWPGGRDFSADTGLQAC